MIARPPAARAELTPRATREVVSSAGAFDTLAAAWRRSAQRWLPLEPAESPWRFSHTPPADLPAQGWKLHISATILSATAVLEAVAPLLHDRGALFKGPASLLHLKKLNCGLFHGFGQVGKFMTVYPSSDDEACELARLLDAATRSFDGPPVPFEARVASGSTVFTRYGSFTAATGNTLRAPDGELVADRRHENPSWAEPPVGLLAQDGAPAPTSGPLASRFLAFEALMQRGKGGVYRALDVGTSPARLCVIKEGRAGGEVDWDASDGRARAERELEVLQDLEATSVPAPRLHHHFEQDGNLYLILEWIDGERLAETLLPGAARLVVADALDLAAQCASVLAAIHERGWVWRDLKAANLIVSGGVVRPLDFEGAARVGSPITSPWGTTGYTPPEFIGEGRASFAQDLYALGVVVHQLLTNAMPGADGPVPALVDSRPDVPAAVARLVERLTDDDPARRGTAQAASHALRDAARRADVNIEECDID